jgi:predicted SAM-dependent methyltransferase
MPIPHADSSVGGIYAFHFLEHLTGAQAIALLMEAQRVLAVGAPMTIVVPHRLGAIAFQDLDHKSFWTEESWKTLFTNPHYDKNRELPWKFDIKFNAIIGIVERNLALMTQLVRTE